jgi:uncharacterized protein DUF3617
MRRALLLSVVLSSSTLLWGADKPKPLNLKLGLWEATSLISMSGAPPVPPEMLAKMTPEQRAKFEARAKARAAEPPRSHTEKSCLKQEDLDQNKMFSSDDDEKACTRTVISSTDTSIEMHVECQGAIKRSGTFKVESSSPENAKGTMHMAATNSDRAMNVDVTFTAKWIAAACGDDE